VCLIIVPRQVPNCTWDIIGIHVYLVRSLSDLENEVTHRDVQKKVKCDPQLVRVKPIWCVRVFSAMREMIALLDDERFFNRVPLVGYLCCNRVPVGVPLLFFFSNRVPLVFRVPLLQQGPVFVFITAGPITKLFAGGGGGEWTTCAMIDDEPRPVWMSPLITH
jgi:hypothetical protein